jgi:hypothetical protein
MGFFLGQAVSNTLLRKMLDMEPHLFGHFRFQPSSAERRSNPAEERPQCVHRAVTPTS